MFTVKRYINEHKIFWHHRDRERLDRLFPINITRRRGFLLSQSLIHSEWHRDGGCFTSSLAQDTENVACCQIQSRTRWKNQRHKEALPKDSGKNSVFCVRVPAGLTLTISFFNNSSDFIVIICGSNCGSTKSEQAICLH